ncbi:MAG: hypothetical protein AUG49_19350 [Catenulispora sp. 13_1_20CM_3_70_7]|nr:MAG: hypothetical protein AUG49_19350 [Catenulispora sp. 13_1_20CM_3_70_7]
MTYTKVDDLVANGIGVYQIIAKDAGTAKAAGQTHTPWYQTGVIGAGAAPTGALNGATLTGPGVAGAIPMPAAVASTFVKMTRLGLTQAGSIGNVWLIDRLWGNVPVVTTTTSQAITSPTWPSRDQTASTNGAKVYLALECSAATGNVGAITNTTVSYTNSAGTAGRTATLVSFPATAVAGTWQMFALQAGDDGVRSVQSITLGTSYVSGQVHLVAFRLVAELATPNVNIANVAGFAQLAMPSVWDNSVLQLVYFPTGTALGALAGSCSYAQG